MMMMMMMRGFVGRVISSPQTRCRSAKQVGLQMWSERQRGESCRQQGHAGNTTFLQQKSTCIVVVKVAVCVCVCRVVGKWWGWEQLCISEWQLHCTQRPVCSSLLLYAIIRYVYSALESWRIVSLVYHAEWKTEQTRNVGQCPTWWPPCRM